VPVDTDKLRDLAPSVNRFLEFEREVENSIRMEAEERRREHEEEKQQREKRARKKRLKKLRALQRQ
jgi:hypothetical protein